MERASERPFDARGEGRAGGDARSERRAGREIDRPYDRGAGSNGPNGEAEAAEAAAAPRKRARVEPAAAGGAFGDGNGENGPHASTAATRKVRVWLPLAGRTVEVPPDTTVGELLRWEQQKHGKSEGGARDAEASEVITVAYV